MSIFLITIWNVCRNWSSHDCIFYTHNEQG